MALSYSGDPSANAAKVRRAQWERYKDIYTPIEDQLIGSLNESTSIEAQRAARQANERAAEVSDRTRERYGMAELSPEMSERENAISGAANKASAYNTGELARIDRRDSIRQSLVQAGQGIVNQATGGLSSASSMQTSRENANAQAEARAEAQESQQEAAMASTAIMAAAMFF